MIPNSIKKRFEGNAGKNKLIEALKKQVLINGDNVISEAIADKVEMIEYIKGNEIIQQDNSDTEMYFILSGSVSIYINKRHIKTRNANTHVGEMVLLDLSQKRSATVVARETTVLAKITEPDFSKIANKYPVLWRRIAAELADRLRERSKYIKEPNSKPIVFIGSSSEQFEVAKSINTGLHSDSIKVKIWKDPDVFNPSHITIDSLFKQATQSDFAVLLLSPDDTVKTRGRKHYAPRDNILFELGLFMGRLGRKRTFIVCPKGKKKIKIPTDILGITLLYYTPGNKASIIDICTKLHRVIKKIGTK